MRRVPLVLLATFLSLLVYISSAQADVGIVLKKSFIKDYHDRATIETNYRVVATHHKPKSPSEDGDIHCSGTSDDIGLACVAEIIHASTQPLGVQKMVAAEGGDPIPVSGVWRIWPEHAGGGQTFIQGDPLDEITNTNPPHVFEIHPLTSVDGQDVKSSFTRVRGYSYKNDKVAFEKFESWPCEISEDGDQVTLVTTQLGYNYVKFRIEMLDKKPHELVDHNKSAYFTVVGPDEEEPLVSKIRCIFVEGTPPCDALETMHAGDQLLVVGVPRVDLALVQYRVDHAQDHPEFLHRTLPYEMIIVGLGK